MVTDDEKTILRCLNHDNLRYRYLTRDDLGNLEAHTEKPRRKQGIWLTRMMSYSVPLRAFNHMFQMVGKNDEEATDGERLVGY